MLAAVTVTAMTTHMTTRIDAMTTPALLHLIWLASPALPVGGFSYSEGLEAGVECGQVHDEVSASAWIVDQLHLGLARSDLAVIAQAIPAWQAQNWPRVQVLNDWVLQTRETHELRRQTEQMGRSLSEWARQFDPAASASPASQAYAAMQAAGLVTPSYPMVCAAVLAMSGASATDALSAHAFGWAENMVQAAIKSVPLGQSAGQRMLARLCLEIPAAVAYAQGLDDHSRQAFTPMLAIHSARHETQYSRLFRS